MTGRRRVALFGGSFNPPHLAHQMACLAVLSTQRADQVWLMPCFKHVFNKPLLPFADRVGMCNALASTFAPGLVSVTEVERDLGEQSRTLITVEHLLQRHPELEFALIIGTDILGESSKWYRFAELRQRVPFIVVGRAGYEGQEGDALVLPNISSSEVRRRLHAGEPVDHLLPAGVLAYLKEHDLVGRLVD
jgi:nicotinate-nucleotide adenylyltransferase